MTKNKYTYKYNGPYEFHVVHIIIIILKKKINQFEVAT